MPKNIIFCADGTWNGPEGKTGQSVLDGGDGAGEIRGGSFTNVVKLFANLAGTRTPESAGLENEDEKALLDADGKVVQVMKYIHGVGDSKNLINKLLGGAFGLGIIARIVRGYTFISRHYDKGDAIVICGFSRGAYTARALAGMIAKVGLLNRKTYDPADKGRAYRLGVAAWAKSKSIALQGGGILDGLAGHILNFVQHVVALPLGANSLVPNVPIKAVAVWDTVGALGIPVYAGDHRYDLFRFVDQDLHPSVECGFHAMAIDELRADFGITRWNPRAGVREVWFVGAHADIGGGYPPAESRLSDNGLGWMIGKLASVGVRFSAPLTAPVDATAIGQSIHTPWTQLPFVGLPQSARQVKADDTLHTSVVARCKADLQYKPQAMLGLNGKFDLCLVDSTTSA